MTLRTDADIFQSPMVDLQKNIVLDMDNPAFIRSGLNSISGEGREYLRDMTKSLLAIQSHPGAPVPDKICRDIMRKPTGESP